MICLKSNCHFAASFKVAGGQDFQEAATELPGSLARISAAWNFLMLAERHVG